MNRRNYGDWCVPPEAPHIVMSTDPARNAPRELVATAYYYNNLMLLSKCADMLGFSYDACELRAQADQIKEAFNRGYLDREAGQYANGTATASVLPLAFGLVPEDVRERIVQRLVDEVMVVNKGHISTGLIGGQWLMRTLSDNGHADVAYTLASQTTYPSWGYMLGKGATTIWELWNGDTAEPWMNSGNHVMLVGDLIVWLYGYVAGIRPEQPGYSEIRLEPCLVEGLEHAKATWESPYGRIASHWTRSGNRLTWRITVPPNTTARVHVPTTDPGSVRESGQALADLKGSRLETTEPGAVIVRVGSGDYLFEARV